MTLLIAILLMNHMGIEGFWPYFGVVCLWFLHLGGRAPKVTLN